MTLLSVHRDNGYLDSWGLVPSYRGSASNLRFRLVLMQCVLSMHGLEYTFTLFRGYKKSYFRWNSKFVFLNHPILKIIQFGLDGERFTHD